MSNSARKMLVSPEAVWTIHPVLNPGKHLFINGDFYDALANSEEMPEKSLFRTLAVASTRGKDVRPMKNLKNTPCCRPFNPFRLFIKAIDSDPAGLFQKFPPESGKTYQHRLQENSF